jgi:hypothetical protein
MVPVMTGMPAGSPVAAAASALTVPAASPGHCSRGSSMAPAMSSAHGRYQVSASES